MTTTEQKVTQVYQTAIVGIHTVDQQGVLRDRPVLETAIIPRHSKMYGMRLSVDADQLKGFRAGEQVTITVERGGERKSPPKWPSDWYWNLSSIVRGHTQQAHVSSDPGPGPEADFEDQFPQGGVDFAKLSRERAAAKNPPPEYRQATGQDVIQTRIAWNSAINNATNLLAAALALPAEERDQLSSYGPSGEREGLRQNIREWTAWYYQVITAGPPQDVPAEPLQNPVQPPEEPEPSQSPAGPITASFEALSAFNGAWRAALARNQWQTEEQALAAVEGYIARNYQQRKLRQLSDAEVAQVTAAVRSGKI